MAAPLHIFGIRHHGPGSARQLIEALDGLGPEAVLIEGPADASDLLPMLADPAMAPPVALLAYAADTPEQAVFWPFARFSPEYQAVCWAVRHGVPVRFIDLPVSWRLPVPQEAPVEAEEEEGEGQDEAAEEQTADAAEPSGLQVHRDPIGVLAYAAGYEDGESWWRDVIEENPAPGPVFTAIADAMAALREDLAPPDAYEAAREAHMRLEIAKERKASEGPVAVVCGAWHVPALTAKHTAKDDRALLKGAPKRKISATWVPWTSPRLAFESGYGAGVAAPGWCSHIWNTDADRIVAAWLVKAAGVLRAAGHVVSTASLIEAERLGRSLSVLRGRPAPGFEELRDAVVSCLCFGDRVMWDVIAGELLVGSEVGTIPENVPLAPLLEDLQRQQKTARLKPEALDRELSLDLRSSSGLFRSTLLHRLNVLDVPWGRLADAGRSRGTFRERWMLRWEPEYSVQLVEQLVYGATIEQAANGRLEADLAKAADLGQLAGLVLSAMTAQLGTAAAAGIEVLGRRAAQTSDCEELLIALPPLADVVRYGEARAVDIGQLGDLMRRIAVQGALALPYAARGLDAEASARFRGAMQAADAAIRLAEFSDDELDQWHQALHALLADAQAARLVSGAAARLLYEAEEISTDDAVELLGRMLSPGASAAEAAAFFEGFFDGAGQRLIYDGGLRACVDEWLLSLDPETFTQYLPLFRRVFSGLDPTERRRLLDAVLGRAVRALPGLAAAPDAEAAWQRHFARLTDILTREPADG